MLFLIVVLVVNFVSTIYAQKITVIWIGYKDNGAVKERDRKEYESVFLVGEDVLAKPYNPNLDKSISLNYNTTFKDFEKIMEDLSSDKNISLYNSSEKPLHLFFVVNTHGNQDGLSINDGKEMLRYENLVKILLGNLHKIQNAFTSKNKRVRLSIFLDVCEAGNIFPIFDKIHKEYKDIAVDILTASGTESYAWNIEGGSPFIATLKQIKENPKSNYTVPKNSFIFKNLLRNLFLISDGVNTHIARFYKAGHNNKKTSTVPKTEQELPKKQTGRKKQIAPLLSEEGAQGIEQLEFLYKTLHDIIGDNVSTSNGILKAVTNIEYYRQVGREGLYPRVASYILNIAKTPIKVIVNMYEENRRKMLYLINIVNTIFPRLLHNIKVSGNEVYFTPSFPNILQSLWEKILYFSQIVNPYKDTEVFVDCFKNLDYHIGVELVKTEKNLSYKYKMKKTYDTLWNLKLYFEHLQLGFYEFLDMLASDEDSDNFDRIIKDIDFSTMPEEAKKILLDYLSYLSNLEKGWGSDVVVQIISANDNNTIRYLLKHPTERETLLIGLFDIVAGKVIKTPDREMKALWTLMHTSSFFRKNEIRLNQRYNKLVRNNPRNAFALLGPLFRGLGKINLDSMKREAEYYYGLNNNVDWMNATMARIIEAYDIGSFNNLLEQLLSGNFVVSGKHDKEQNMTILSLIIKDLFKDVKEGVNTKPVEKQLSSIIDNYNRLGTLRKDFRIGLNSLVKNILATNRRSTLLEKVYTTGYELVDFNILDEIRTRLGKEKSDGFINKALLGLIRRCQGYL